ncbi:hypothetical protein BDU57DRAFT_23391 [Ampelomyces quisqualis]|uniref:F-box domain-containing protein n=1 Tax=Ampelomyces quisqualis TaxID=50730 RepID=A0A6A5QY82_AMPQU|nr:hypothetical protein BDU57DRAFT_23391 [Ampelomyces quisqualis]
MSGARTFFDLPLELREQVYKDVLASPHQGPDILRSCREILNEAHKFLYQRPISLGSQEALCDWSIRIPSDLLLNVSEIALHVQDVNLKPILDSQSSERSHLSPRLLTWELYEQEVHRIEQALKRLPKIKIITLRALPCRPSFLYREFVTQVLNVLSTSCPELVDLRLEANFHHQDLRFLPSLANLRAFSFDGFSLSSPAATAKILASLPHLSSLSVISERTFPIPNAESPSDYNSSRQSFTGDVARTLKHLASFSVTERIPAASSTMFFTRDLFISLRNHKTLASLTVNLSHGPGTEILQSLGEFLESTLIERLELDWPDLHAGIVEQYQILCASLKVLWIRARSQVYASSILSSVADSLDKKDMFSLAKVVLLRSKKEARDQIGDGKDGGTGSAKFEACDDKLSTHDGDNIEFCRARQRVREMNIHVAWCTHACQLEIR